MLEWVLKIDFGIQIDVILRREVEQGFCCYGEVFFGTAKVCLFVLLDFFRDLNFSLERRLLAGPIENHLDQYQDQRYYWDIQKNFSYKLLSGRSITAGVNQFANIDDSKMELLRRWVMTYFS